MLIESIFCKVIASSLRFHSYEASVEENLGSCVVAVKTPVIDFFMVRTFKVLLATINYLNVFVNNKQS